MTTTKKINEIISPNGFTISKEGSKYVLNNKSARWVLKGTLKDNLETILGLAGIKQDIIKEDEINEDVVQLFKYAYDILRNREDVAKSKMVYFKTINLDGVGLKIDKAYKDCCFNGRPFNRIWQGIMHYMHRNIHDETMDEAVAKFQKEMTIKRLVW